VRQGVEVPARRAAEDRDQRVLVESRHIGDGRERSLAQLLRGDRADPPEPFDGKGMEEAELVVDRHHEQAVRFGDAARDLRQELRARHADRDRDADALAHLGAEPHRDLGRRSGDALEPADVEERLVDREALDQWRRVAEHVEHRVAGFAVRLHPWTDHDRLWAHPACLCLAHRGVHAEGLGLVAGGEHHAATDDHRLAAQRRVVALFDGRVEGVGVRVQDRGSLAHRTMLAPATDTPVGRLTPMQVRLGQGRWRAGEPPVDDELLQRSLPDRPELDQDRRVAVEVLHVEDAGDAGLEHGLLLDHVVGPHRDHGLARGCLVTEAFQVGLGVRPLPREPLAAHRPRPMPVVFAIGHLGKGEGISSNVVERGHYASWKNRRAPMMTDPSAPRRARSFIVFVWFLVYKNVRMPAATRIKPINES
jgi:hypothetical protein